MASDVLLDVLLSLPTLHAYSQNIRTCLSTEGYVSIIAGTSACLRLSYRRYSWSIEMVESVGEKRWIGRPCWHTLRGRSIRSCYYATNIWSRRITSYATRSRAVCG